MFYAKSVFSSFAVDDLQRAKEFYGKVLNLQVVEEPNMGLKVVMKEGIVVFIYPKENHQPATFTVLNFAVDNIDEAVDQLKSNGVEFIRYDEGMLKTDEKGIARGRAKGNGPDIAWFKDPAGNFISILQ